jgi:large subunit ribosomal protein L31
VNTTTVPNETGSGDDIVKTGIHPEYTESTVKCSCGNTFITRSTSKELHIELCDQCHPFYTGKQRLVDSGGRVERFRKRYAKAGIDTGVTPAEKGESSHEEA